MTSQINQQLRRLARKKLRRLLEKRTNGTREQIRDMTRGMSMERVAVVRRKLEAR